MRLTAPGITPALRRSIGRWRAFPMSVQSPDLVNPEAIAGHNEAPISAQSVTAAMARDYAAMAEATGALLAEARALPDSVGDEGDLQVVSAFIVKIRDKAKLANATREKEKEQ